MRDLTWSPAEKSVARRAFNKALDSELEEVIRKTKRMAGNIKEAADLWKLEKYLTHARNEIDEKYDYRYSVLPIVFGNLIYSGQLSLEDLDGLGEDKLKFIRSYAFVYGEPD